MNERDSGNFNVEFFWLLNLLALDLTFQQSCRAFYQVAVSGANGGKKSFNHAEDISDGNNCSHWFIKLTVFKGLKHFFLKRNKLCISNTFWQEFSLLSIYTGTLPINSPNIFFYLYIQRHLFESYSSFKDLKLKPKSCHDLYSSIKK